MQKVILRFNGRLPDEKLDEARRLFERLIFGEGLVVIDNRWDVFVLGEDENEEE